MEGVTDVAAVRKEPAGLSELYKHLREDFYQTQMYHKHEQSSFHVLQFYIMWKFFLLHFCFPLISAQ